MFSAKNVVKIWQTFSGNYGPNIPHKCFYLTRKYSRQTLRTNSIKTICSQGALKKKQFSKSLLENKIFFYQTFLDPNYEYRKNILAFHLLSHIL